MRILLAEDDDNYRKLLRDFLSHSGYQVVEAEDGEKALHLFHTGQQYDLLILDVMMPKMNGFEVCQTIREMSEVPVLFLTALTQEENELEALRLGADEYIRKPFSYKVFIARVNALLRKQKQALAQQAVAGKLTVDFAAQKVFVSQQLVPLTHTEYALLQYLMENTGKTLSREKILLRLWGYDYDGETRNVDTHIKTLRAKLGQDAGGMIKTVRSIGYRFEQE